MEGPWPARSTRDPIANEKWAVPEEGVTPQTVLWPPHKLAPVHTCTQDDTQPALRTV